MPREYYEMPNGEQFTESQFIAGIFVRDENDVVYVDGNKMGRVANTKERTGNSDGCKIITHYLTNY